MAENKKSFLMYCDQIHLFEELSDEEAGRLIKHIFRYVNDQNPECPDRITKLGFEPIKHQLKRDLVRYEARVNQTRQAGKASAEAKRIAKEGLTIQRPLTTVNEPQRTPTKSTDNGTDKETVTVIERKNTVFVPPTAEEITNYVLGVRQGCVKENAQLFAEKFFSHYESKGWVVGKSKMKNWKVTITGTWKETLEQMLGKTAQPSAIATDHRNNPDYKLGPKRYRPLAEFATKQQYNDNCLQYGHTPSEL